MNMKYTLLSAVLFSAVLGASGMEHSLDSAGNRYEFVKNDPFNVRIYKLKNGLTVYLARTPRTPTVSVVTAVRAGSTDESPDSTGLAHYFEHMMFKGTPRMGALNWAKEKALLDKIESLFEERRNTADPKKKEALYKEIDRLSFEAAKYASTNEFSKLASLLGTDKLNAMTGYDSTCYVAQFPANELEKYLKLDAERFSEPVMRLFHTELEAVYEEFNLMQNRDGSRAFLKVLAELFPEHPLGRPIIGSPDHLRNPSISDIYKFRRKYYIPGNMAVVLVGDFEYEKALSAVESAFGKMPFSKVVERKTPVEKDLKGMPKFEIVGPEPEQLLIGFRIKRTSRNAVLITMLSRMLNDNGYGLLEQNLQRPHLLQNASNYPMFERDYLVFFLGGMPKKGQSLEEVEKLLLAQVHAVEQGKYEDWRPMAVVDNTRVTIAEMCEDDSMTLAKELADLYVSGEPYDNLITTPEQMCTITKKELSDFIRKLTSNAVVVYKRNGTAKGLLRVEKPAITPVLLNQTKTSEFAEKFAKLPPSPSVKPEFPDPEKILKTVKMPSGMTLRYDTRKNNSKLFAVRIYSKYGRNHNREINFALGYMDSLGTGKFSADDLRKEFYKLGVTFELNTNRDGSFAEISGPANNFEKAIVLFHEFICNAKPDAAALKRHILFTQRERANDKLNQNKAFFRLINYARYGKDHPFSYVITEEQMKKVKPEELTQLVKRIFTGSDISFIYTGPDSLAKVKKTAALYKTFAANKIGREKQYTDRMPVKPTVYLLDFDSTRIQVGFVAPGAMFNKDTVAISELFNEYFGFGLDSVVFQEIRESRALAYNAGTAYLTCDRINRRDMIYGIVQTQKTKLFDAIDAMQAILKKMPLSDSKFTASKNAVVKQTETRRYLDMELHDYELRLNRMNSKAEWRKELFRDMQHFTLKDVESFFNSRIRTPVYDLLVIGRISAEDRKKLAKYGNIVEMNIKDVFGY